MASPFHATSPSSAAAEIDLTQTNSESQRLARGIHTFAFCRAYVLTWLRQKMAGHKQVNDDTTIGQIPRRKPPPRPPWNVWKKAPTRLRNKSRNSEDSNCKGALGPGLTAGEAAAAAPGKGGVFCKFRGGPSSGLVNAVCRRLSSGTGLRIRLKPVSERQVWPQQRSSSCKRDS